MHLLGFWVETEVCPLCRCPTALWVACAPGRAPQFLLLPSLLDNSGFSYLRRISRRWETRGGWYPASSTSSLATCPTTVTTLPLQKAKRYLWKKRYSVSEGSMLIEGCSRPTGYHSLLVEHVPSSAFHQVTLCPPGHRRLHPCQQWFLLWHHVQVRSSLPSKKYSCPTDCRYLHITNWKKFSLTPWWSPAILNYRRFWKVHRNSNNQVVTSFNYWQYFLLQNSCRIPAQRSSKLPLLVHSGAIHWQHCSVQRRIPRPTISPLCPQQQVSLWHQLAALCVVVSVFSVIRPVPRSLNVDMEWLYGASESSNMEVDIGYLPQVQPRGGWVYLLHRRFFSL